MHLLLVKQMNKPKKALLRQLIFWSRALKETPYAKKIRVLKKVSRERAQGKIYRLAFVFSRDKNNLIRCLNFAFFFCHSW